MPAKIAMMAMTTNNSIKVNAAARRGWHEALGRFMKIQKSRHFERRAVGIVLLDFITPNSRECQNDWEQIDVSRIISKIRCFGLQISKCAMRSCCTVVVFVFALVVPHWTRAEVITLNPSADTAIFQKFPTNNLGTYTDMPIGTTRDGNRGRGLIKFDLSQIPQNAVINSVSLQFQVVNEPASAVSSTFALHRMLRSWNEGVGGTQLGTLAVTNDTTWSARIYPDTPWGALGAASGVDYSAATNGETFVVGIGTYTFQSTPTMVADVQFWLTNNNSNFGWMLMSAAESSPFTARRVASRE